MSKKYRCIGVSVPSKDTCGLVTVCYLPEEEKNEDVIDKYVYISTNRGFKRSNVEDNIHFCGEELPAIEEGEKSYYSFYAREVTGVPHYIFDDSFYNLYQKVRNLSKKYRFQQPFYHWLQENQYVSCYHMIGAEVMQEFLKKNRMNLVLIDESQKYHYWSDVILPLYDSYDRRYFYFKDDFDDQYLVILNVDMTIHIHSVRVMEGLRRMRQPNGDPYLKVNQSFFYSLTCNDAWSRFLTEKYDLQIWYV